jgi:hypothetical protein
MKAMRAKMPPPAPRELVIVVDPEAGLRVRKEGIESVNKQADVKPLEKLISSEKLAIQPLYGVSEEWLIERTYSRETLMGVNQPVDLSIFYKITAPDKRLEKAAARLRKLEIVKSAYIKPGAALTISDNSIQFSDGLAPGRLTDNFTARQIYLEEASQGGVDARFAWSLDGGEGSGVNIIDVEGAWRFSHEDLLEHQGGLIGGIPVTELGWRNHGTAVLGVISGDHNTFGITGICHKAEVRAASVFGNSNGDPAPNWSAAAAIRLAADMLHPGDIILIEHHLPGPALNFEVRDDQVGYIPVEWWPCNLAAIQYATGRGILVVEAGGNGQQNLDLAIYDQKPSAPNGPFPDWWRNPFRRNPIDTKAILVGAGAPPESVHGTGQEPDRSKLESSNFGTSIDAQAWGDDVVTSGYGGLQPNDPDEDRWYTSRFNGTSSAAVMIAGVLGCLQGIQIARGGRLEPERARELLRDSTLNSPQQAGPFGAPVSDFRIGPRPDLRQLINHL